VFVYVSGFLLHCEHRLSIALLALLAFITGMILLVRWRFYYLASGNA
jgi:hypothetical protein